MALSPLMPTSFVPKQAPAKRLNYGSNFDFGGAMALLGYGLFLITLVLALGTFGYEWYLSRQESAKRAEVLAAEQHIDHAAVERLLKLNYRLTESKRLLNNHVALSQLFTPIEAALPLTIHFVSFDVVENENHGGIINAKGVAVSLNALAVLATEINKGKGIKDLIFSDISVDKSGKINFALTAITDPSLTTFGAQSLNSASPVSPETGTPATE